MARQTISELEERIRELEAEVETLQASPPRETVPSGSGPSGTGPGEAEPPATPRKRSWGWTLLATCLVVIGSLLAPVAIVASWTRVELTDTDRFVGAYSKLAAVPAVQDYVAAQTLVAIKSQVDIPALTSNVIDGIISLGTPERATQALELLKGPAASGLESLVQGRIEALVRSAVFRRVWTEALRVTHSQLQATMRNDPDAAVALGSDGTIGIQLAPIIAAAKKALVADGITFASQIPAIDRTITVARSDSIPLVQLVYNLALAAGTWLPVISVVFLAAGVLVARRRSVALVWAAIALALTSGILGAGLAIGRGVFVLAVSPTLLPGGVSSVVYDTVVGAMQATCLAVVVLALAVAVVGWFGGGSRSASRLRALATAGAAGIRQAAESRGISTGRAGRWLWEQRVLTRVVVIVIASAVVVFTRPLTPALIVWTAVLALLAVAVLELVQRPPLAEPGDHTPDAATTAGDNDNDNAAPSPVSGEGAFTGH